MEFLTEEQKVLMMVAMKVCERVDNLVLLMADLLGNQ